MPPYAGHLAYEGNARLIGMAGQARHDIKLMPAGSRRGLFAARAPDIDAGEQEQPDHVDEVPVPGGELEAEMLGRRELAHVGTDQAHGEEDGADDDMRAMEAGRHEKGRAIDVAFEGKSGMAVFIRLHGGEG